MSGSALDAALSGLRVAQQQLSVISTNIANVQTPGYTRKILPQSVRTVDNEAVGVIANAAIRKVDLYLTRDLWTQVSSVGALDAKLRYMDQIETFHGDPSAEKTIPAKIANLKDRLLALSDQPLDSYSLNATVEAARDAAGQINQLADLVSQLRIDAEDEMTQVVNRINDLLGQIAAQNQEIAAAGNQGRSVASFEDLRDNAVKELASLIDVGFFLRGDGVMVVQTKSGVQLVDERPSELYFKPSNPGPDEFYPDTVNGVFIGGDPSVRQTAFDMIPYNLGGKLGALIDVRDEILPRYQAQLDETAFRLAQRFDSQGLRLFTDQNGQLPLDTAPVPNPPGPLTAVDYIGFAQVIQVNELIVDDPTLLQKGTTGDLIQNGSNEVIRRAIEFALGTLEYQSVTGTRDIRVSVNPLGDTLQENLGLYSSNTLLSTKNLATFTSDITAAAGNPFGPTSDDFTLRFSDGRIGVDSGTVTIDLSVAAAAYPLGSAGVGAGIGTVDNAAEQLASYINSLAWPADMAVAATVNIYGQLTLQSRGNIQIGAGSMGAAGMDFLGLQAGTQNTTDPYFDVVVGNNPSVRITVEPGDDQNDLIAKIGAVPGIDPADVVLNGSGHLSFRPERGGDIRVIGGPFTSVAGFSTAGGNSIIAEIFGSNDPVVDQGHPPFRNALLGPNVALGTSIVSATSIIDYAQKMVGAQIDDKVTTQNLRADEDQYRQTLETKLTNESGVNVDEEMANLIVIQNAYAAAARALNTVNEMFRELIDSVR